MLEQDTFATHQLIRSFIEGQGTHASFREDICKNSGLSNFSSAGVSGPNLAISATGVRAGRKHCSSPSEKSFSSSKKLTEVVKQMEKRRRVAEPSVTSESVTLQSRSL
jgi:hypothetical protein